MVISMKKQPVLTEYLLTKLGLHTQNCEYDKHTTNLDFVKKNGLIGFPILMLKQIKNPDKFIATLMRYLDNVKFDERGNPISFTDIFNNDFVETWNEENLLIYSRKHDFRGRTTIQEFTYSNGRLASEIYTDEEGNSYLSEFDAFGNQVHYKCIRGPAFEAHSSYDSHNNLTMYKSGEVSNFNMYEYWPTGQIKRINNMEFPNHVDIHKDKPKTTKDIPLGLSSPGVPIRETDCTHVPNYSLPSKVQFVFDQKEERDIWQVKSKLGSNVVVAVYVGTSDNLMLYSDKYTVTVHGVDTLIYFKRPLAGRVVITKKEFRLK